MPRLAVLVRMTALLCLPVLAGAEALREDQGHVYRWNKFTDDLHVLHLEQLHGRSIREEVAMGGYPGQPAFYREVKYFDADTGRLLSIVQRESAHPERIHSITVYRHDDLGRVVRDYSSSYLPDYRNAPTQTLVFVHRYNNGLHAFRSFDASDDLLYEQCEGEIGGEKIFISLDIDEIEEAAGELYQHDSGIMKQPAYRRCFGGMPASAAGALPPR